MKKTWIILSSVLLLAVASIIIIIVVFHNQANKVKKFSVSDYSTEIKNFPSEITLGPIPDAPAASQQAESVWINTFGETVEDEKPYIVSFDSENGVWLITGTLPPNTQDRITLGGVAYILMRKEDGKVLAVWHTK